jgi:hypothetical protein
MHGQSQVLTFVDLIISETDFFNILFSYFVGLYFFDDFFDLDDDDFLFFFEAFLEPEVFFEDFFPAFLEPVVFLEDFFPAFFEPVVFLEDFFAAFLELVVFFEDFFAAFFDDFLSKDFFSDKS